jgi:hypothetical protein
VASLEQLKAKLVFEQLDLPADRGRRDVQFVRSELHAKQPPTYLERPQRVE